MAAIARIRRPVSSSVLSIPTRPILPREAPSRWWTSRTLTTPTPKGSRTFVSTVPLSEKKYTKDHEWIELSDDGKTGTIGISTYAAKALGDVVYVELPTKDLEISAGDAMGAVESVKSASDINCPISGTVIEANDVLEEKPSMINQSPEGDGWIAKIEVKDETEMKGLMGSKEYNDFTSDGTEEK